MKKNKFYLFTIFAFSVFVGCGGINEPPFSVSENPSVSPDGKTVAFSCYPVNGDKTQPGIYIMSIDGNNKKLVYPLKYGTLQNSIEWNPSGRQMLFEEGIITLQNNEFKEIRQNEITYLNKDAANFIWSPDGNNILYNINDSVYICDTLFQNSRKLPLKAYQPTWMPDGKTLAYIKNDEIYIADTVNYQEVQITNDGNKKVYLKVSPNAAIFCYIGYSDSGSIGLLLVDSNGSNSRLLIKNYLINRNSVGHSWTPDSRSIVYPKQLGDMENQTIWKINIDGTDDIQISK